MKHTLPSVQARPSKALHWPILRRHVQLAIGVGATLGGAVLLGSNITYLVMSGASALPWVPLVANAALIFGGAMFLRLSRRRDNDRDSGG